MITQEAQFKSIKNAFNAIGARVNIETETRESAGPITLDINAKKDEIFTIKVKKEVEALVADVQKDDKHLLLLCRIADKNNKSRTPVKQMFLCGHDERHWFVAGIPSKVSTVWDAKQALKPAAIKNIEESRGVKRSIIHSRHKKLNDGTNLPRQGEFFFVAEPNFEVPRLAAVHHHEPMRVGSKKPHMAEWLYRMLDGEVVYTSNTYDRKARSVGYTEMEYQHLRRSSIASRNSIWKQERRNATVMVKGKITHKDHATLNLGDVWHQVIPNSEAHDFRFGSSVAFID